MFDYSAGVSEQQTERDLLMYGRPKPLNYEQPPHVPVRPQGRVPVIARFEWGPGDIEWLPGHAIRWTSGHVMVVYFDERSGRKDDITWLRASDVLRKAVWLIDPATGGPPAEDEPRRYRAG